MQHAVGSGGKARTASSMSASPIPTAPPTGSLQQTKSSPNSLFQTQEREKKNTHLASCTDQHRHFTPFLATTDGVLGNKAGGLPHPPPHHHPVSEMTYALLSCVRSHPCPNQCRYSPHTTHLCMRVALECPQEAT
jgi:hypothetical protein